MKKSCLLFSIVLLVIVCFSNLSFANLTGKIGHEKYVYPIVRVSDNAGTGSGTVIYSKALEGGVYSTYILTNHHVISGAIKIEKEWDTQLQKEVKKERRSVVYVEIFKYRDLSTPVGTLKIEADIVIYTETEDMAVLKLRYDEPVEYVATLPVKDATKTYRVLDEAIASGCSLGWPTLPSRGIITRLGYLLNSIPYDMSSAQIIYGNSGGAMFLTDGTFIGIPSRVAVMGWSMAITHMGAFIPVYRIYEWLEKEHYNFIYDPEKSEAVCLEEREAEIKIKKDRGGERN